MAEYINATNDPELFKTSRQNGQKVFADLDDGTCLEWNGTNLLYLWPCHRFQGDFRDSIFPGLFKRNDPDLKPAFAFYDEITKKD